MDLLRSEADKPVLIIGDKNSLKDLEHQSSHITNKTVSSSDFEGISENAYNAVFVKLPENHLTNTFLGKVLKLAQPGACIVINKVSDIDNIEFLLKTTGFSNVEVKKSTEVNLVAQKPNYEVGSSKKLNLKKPAVAVWKLDDNDEEEETIDPDNLLDEEDLKRPDPSSLRVCGTTGKRKACKDCSCGLADELADEAKSGKIVDTTDAPKSSCGSCYLGDAFRCASCPYLGMPAFKPGEKIQLSDNLLKADL